VPAGVDLDYRMEDFEPGAGSGRDSLFYHQRTDRAVLDEVVSQPPGRALDVACGSGALAARLGEAGWEAWGLEASSHMLGLGRWQGFDRRVVMVRGIAEALPFREGSFDGVLCKGSLDHFADQAASIEEAARVLRPDGRLVIALANFDALSRRLGRGIHAIARALGTPGPDARPPGGGRPYWEPPTTHTVRGDLAYVRSLGGRRFALERCYGVSLLHHFRPWRLVVNRLPPRVGWAAMTVLDRVARRFPAASDMIVAVWRPRRQGLARQVRPRRPAH
jgi:SAM-dependent methyltransferase